jgi:YHS domain-containing protein
MKKTLISMLMILFMFNLKAADTCLLMIGEENDPEETTTVEGKSIPFCCGSCVTKFEENKAYYIAAVKDLFVMFSEEERKKLQVDKVVLLKQRRCPIYPERVVNPNCPTVEYKGVTIYFWSSSAVRRWKRDPDKYYEQAKAAGVL